MMERPFILVDVIDGNPANVRYFVDFSSRILNFSNRNLILMTDECTMTNCNVSVIATFRFTFYVYDFKSLRVNVEVTLFLNLTSDSSL